MNKKWAYILALTLASFMPFSASAEGNKTITPRASQSVLASGNWAKVSVSSSGIYLLTNSALSQMGYSDPSKVAIFGNGGSAIPFSNNTLRIDDLHQVPCLRTDKGLLFYAEGIVTWESEGSRYSASVNPYSNHSYYFITDTSTPGIVPSSAPVVETSDVSSVNSSTALMYSHHENNDVNLQKSGRDWFGEELKNSKSTANIDMSLPRRSSPDDLIYLDFRLVSTSSASTSYTVTFNGKDVASGTISGIGSNDYARSITRSVNFKSDDTSASKVTVSMTFNSSADRGWIDYVTATTTSPLDMANASQIRFSTPAGDEFDNIFRYSIANAPSSLQVWDVSSPSEPRAMNVTSSSFVASVDNARSFVAFSSNGTFDEPSFVGRVANQNLHAQQGVNYIIITVDEFLDEAKRLAEAHTYYSGLSVAVVTCNQIYNEFSSGKRDVTALRDYVKMVRDRGLRGQGDDLRCVLLFGQGSYNNILESDNNRVPTYQSSNSISSTQTYVTDDFFGWLDDNEGSSDVSARLDVGVGRFPCSTIEQARNLVNKSITYLSSLDPGSWKASVTFASDDGDENEHLINAEKMAAKFEQIYPDMTVNRIFIEAYKASQTSTGIIYHQAHTDFMNAFNNGSTVIDYVGHAAAYGFTGDGLFHQNDIVHLTNKTRLPLLITAACDFCPFDHNIFSGSEEGLIYPNGGFIGVLGSSRIVYSTSNYKLNNAVLDYLFADDAQGHPLTIGEAISRGKVASGGLVNSLKYIYLGDPAIILPRQSRSVSVETVNGEPAELSDTPLQALNMSTIAGSVYTASGNVDSTFNGTIQLVLFDKRSTTYTSGLKSSVYSFEEYKNPVYKGSAEVRNGRYTLDFMLSKDINPDVQYGRAFLYAVADNQQDEAYGAYNQILVGGIADKVEVDSDGPSIKAWVDFEQFHDGQISGANPVLYATFEDASGINTSGLGAGHDLCVYINGDRNNAICLNGDFVYDAGSHTRGSLTYRFSGIADGLQCLTLKAWDNVNNSSSVDLNLKVVGGSDITFGQTQLFPSPLDVSCQPLMLRFTHNDGATTLKLNVRVFAVDGSLMARASFDVVSAANTATVDLSASVPGVSTLPRGLYLVSVDVDSSSGRKGSFTKRLSVK
ncbi:MAG: type IX secretion system sortase PorU [Bacteroidales bacterium]|nr:type IX secretion system sortase PorU [Bacteroidales bacterium]